MDFTRRTAIITGAGSARGFGVHAALMLVKQGANLMILDINGEGAERTAELCRKEGREGIRAASMGVDLTSEEEVKRAVSETMKLFGRIDILMNIAGITQKKIMTEITLEEWNRMMNVDMTSIFLMCREVVPIMKAQHYGRIVNMSSVSARNGGGVFGGSHYCAAKAACIGFSKAVAKEVAKDGITVNCVAPGASKTDIGAGPYEKKPHPVGVPMDRRGEADETASALVYLASEEVSFITGATIDVNGGSYMV